MSRPHRILVALALGALFVATTPLSSRTARAAEDVDLLGTWYVLVHYKDESTANPNADRWLDLVWVFAMKGSRLEWQEYPLVVFEDQTGRFEAIPGNPRARTLRAWEPNAEQLAVIDEGPHVNDRGARTKTLRGSSERGWKTPDRPGMGMGASVLGYRERLRIEQPTTLPVFVRTDVLGNEFKTSGEGHTVYTTTEVRDGGDTLVGTYERDGHRRGVFRLRRTPSPRGLIEKEGTPNERLVEKHRATGGIGAMGLGTSSSGVREGFDEGDDF
jgi:hypothetical protein